MAAVLVSSEVLRAIEAFGLAAQDNATVVSLMGLDVLAVSKALESAFTSFSLSLELQHLLQSVMVGEGFVACLTVYRLDFGSLSCLRTFGAGGF